jgi:hypothetical protein
MSMRERARSAGAQEHAQTCPLRGRAGYERTNRASMRRLARSAGAQVTQKRTANGQIR